MYVLDANVFIQAKNDYYAPEIVPGFWYWLLKAAVQKRICSIKNVYQELLDYKDELTEWTKKNSQIFVDIDEETSSFHRRILPWVEQNYEKSGVNRFADGADPWLVAYAGAHGLTLVTQEKARQKSRTKVKIPDVCDHFKVKYCNTFEMLKAEKARFVDSSALISAESEGKTL